jgi:hypothetical protein
MVHLRRSLLQFRTLKEKRGRQFLQSSIDKASVAQIREACARQRLVPGAAYKVAVISVVVV